MVTPVDALAGCLAVAQPVIVKPNVTPASIPLRFNPTEYQIQKQNTFAEIAIPGLDSPPLQFVRGGGRRLSVEALLDTSDTLVDVRKKYVDGIEKLLRVNSQTHAPPLVAFEWDKRLFSGVLESATTSYLMFTEA